MHLEVFDLTISRIVQAYKRVVVCLVALALTGQVPSSPAYMGLSKSLTQASEWNYGDCLEALSWRLDLIASPCVNHSSQSD